MESSFTEKDLGIVIDKLVTKSQQCDLMAKKVNSILGCVGKSVMSQQREVTIVVLSLGSHLNPSFELACSLRLHLYK